MGKRDIRLGNPLPRGLFPAQTARTSALGELTVIGLPVKPELVPADAFLHRYVVDWLVERHHRDVRRLFADMPDRVYIGGQGVPKSARTTSTRVSFMPGLSLPESVERIVSDLGRVPGRARARA